MTQIGYGNRTVVTAENIADMQLPGDQQAELEVGCESWGILYAGGCRGQITVWPKQGRAAIEFGGDSEWGDWNPETRLIYTEDGIVYDVDGDQQKAYTISAPRFSGYTATHDTMTDAKEDAARLLDIPAAELVTVEGNDTTYCYASQEDADGDRDGAYAVSITEA